MYSLMRIAKSGSTKRVLKPKIRVKNWFIMKIGSKLNVSGNLYLIIWTAISMRPHSSWLHTSIRWSHSSNTRSSIRNASGEDSYGDQRDAKRPNNGNRWKNQHLENQVKKWLPWKTKRRFSKTLRRPIQLGKLVPTLSQHGHTTIPVPVT